MSLCQLSDDDCITILNKNEINILKVKALILKGHVYKKDGLWDISISRPVRNRAIAIITRDNTKTELIQYIHRLCFNPTPRTFLKVTKNGKFLTFSGLNNQQLLKHLPPSIAT